MKTKINFEELEKTIDFESVGKKLLGLAESGGLNRRKTVADLLDKVREALLKTRETGVGVAALSAFLRESGIPVSEATLRQYLRTHGGGKKTRRKSTTKPAAASKPSSEAQPQPEPKPEPKPVQSWIEERRVEDAPAVPDVFGRRSRGPRIADPKNP
jgi:hypothetical protein